MELPQFKSLLQFAKPTPFSSVEIQAMRRNNPSLQNYHHHDLITGDWSMATPIWSLPGKVEALRRGQIRQTLKTYGAQVDALPTLPKNRLGFMERPITPARGRPGERSWSSPASKTAAAIPHHRMASERVRGSSGSPTSLGNWRRTTWASNSPLSKGRDGLDDCRPVLRFQRRGERPTVSSEPPVSAQQWTTCVCSNRRRGGV